jgi:hypothetical protein
MSLGEPLRVWLREGQRAPKVGDHSLAVRVPTLRSTVSVWLCVSRTGTVRVLCADTFGGGP